MNQWLKRQNKDPWVKKAKALGYRSRAYAKLAFIQQKYQIIMPNTKVLDCGASPGSWCQVVLEHLSQNGRLVAVDLLEMPALDGVLFYQGDVEEDTTIEALKALNHQALFDTILTDIAPNTTGIQQVDQIRQLGIVEGIMAILPDLLIPGGHFVAKVFQGVGYEDALKVLKQDFEKVSICKPEASRKESKEVYWVARNYQTT